VPHNGVGHATQRVTLATPEASVAVGGSKLQKWPHSTVLFGAASEGRRGRINGQRRAFLRRAASARDLDAVIAVIRASQARDDELAVRLGVHDGNSGAGTEGDARPSSRQKEKVPVATFGEPEASVKNAALSPGHFARSLRSEAVVAALLLKQAEAGAAARQAVGIHNQKGVRPGRAHRDRSVSLRSGDDVSYNYSPATSTYRQNGALPPSENGANESRALARADVRHPGNDHAFGRGRLNNAALKSGWS